MGHWEAYRARMKRNNDELKSLADDVIKLDSSIEVYHHYSERNISSITFIKNDKVTGVSFTNVPYRWNGPKNRSKKDVKNIGIPFTAEDVLGSFHSFGKIFNAKKDKTDKENFLNYARWLTPYVKEPKEWKFISHPENDFVRTGRNSAKYNNVLYSWRSPHVVGDLTGWAGSDGTFIEYIFDKEKRKFTLKNGI